MYKKWVVLCLTAVFLSGSLMGAPRIVNIVNFIRLLEPRDPAITEEVLYQTVVRQVEMMRKYKLGGTFLLQYDALMDPRYQKLLKSLPRDSFEIGAWWEIPQPLVEKAGLTWRGRYPWDWRANIGFSTGYTPEERERLVDVYMSDFKAIFGYYPRSVGSWFIDEHTLEYLYRKYKIVASCNCKDQYGTDGYTLWGGYWNQAYYPSKLNSYMPAQDEAEQIPVPIFRMLGSDPIRQYDNGLGSERQGVVTLEPVYKDAGGDSAWVKWFFDQFVSGEPLAFAYTQAGQENSFTWDAMAKGFSIQLPLIARLRNEHRVDVQTLEQSGRWFSSHYKVTPATAVTVNEDLKGSDRKTVWFDSRYYRANLLWEDGGLRFRDIHLFDERLPSPYLTTPATSNACAFFTLPFVDGYVWNAGLKFMDSVDGREVLLKGGKPLITSNGPGKLHIVWGRFVLDMDERQIRITGTGHWFLDLTTADKAPLPFTGVAPHRVECLFEGLHYGVTAVKGSFFGPGIRVKPESNELVLDFSGEGVTGMQTEHLSDPLGIDAAHPRLSWRGAGAYAVSVGTDSLAVAQGRGWKVQGGASQTVVYDGPALQPFTRYYWMVGTHSPVAHFETGMMNQQNWQGSWITDTRDIRKKPAAYFRHAFAISKPIVSARLYIAAAGLYELSINGKRIGDRVLDPMYTRFDRRTLYTTYDVTDALQHGENALGVLLGNGWYNLQSTAVWYFDKAPWRARPSFCLDLRVTYADGTVGTISSGEDWKTASSPIVFNSIYTGEHVDARLDIPHWNEPSFSDTAWRGVTYVAAPSRNITAETMVPIRIEDSLPAVSVRRFSDSDYVFDIGQNTAGVSRIRVEGPAGTVLRLKHGERLYPDGHVDQSNIDVHYRPTDDTDPFGTDIYTLKGEGVETFQPRFNYKGFQYVEVSSSRPVTLDKKSLTGYFMHSDVPSVGEITSSNPVLDKIWAATNRSYLSNLFGYPTDCPQREKNGWTGDAQIAVETGLYNFDAITVYEKWLADLRDEQQPNGVLPSIVPTGGWGYEWGNGPDWTSAIAMIPWNVYLFYGDSKLLGDCYDNIKRYVDHINSGYPSGLTTWGLGDWIPVKSKTPVEFTSTAYYYADVVILREAAKIFHRPADYATYKALATKIRDAFNQKYLNPATGNYDEGFQTELSVALHWGLVPDAFVHKTAALLARRVQDDGVKLDVGLLGTKTILNALSENGYGDLAYKLAVSEKEPSWGWWIVNGATTLYENWPIDSKSDISLNHIMFGEIGAWFYKGLGGIYPDTARPGFQHILLKPYIEPSLDHFTATHRSPYGEIRSGWSHEDGRLVYAVTIPPGSSATLTLEGTVKELPAGQYRFITKDY